MSPAPTNVSKVYHTFKSVDNNDVLTRVIIAPIFGHECLRSWQKMGKQRDEGVINEDPDEESKKS